MFRFNLSLRRNKIIKIIIYINTKHLDIIQNGRKRKYKLYLNKGPSNFRKITY
jgi:hypothetical protein